MKKEFAFNTLSTEKFCIDCGKALKARIAKNKPTASRCFKCWIIHSVKMDGSKFKSARGIAKDKAMSHA